MAESTIVLTQANCTNPGAGSNTFVYSFPTSVNFSNHSIALQSVSTSFSWFNITAALANNSFSFTIYPADAWARTYTVTLPDGAYNVTDIDSYFKYFCIQNGLYMVSPAGAYSYLASFSVNTVRYAIELQTFSFVLPPEWTLPVTFPLPPTGAAAGAVWNPVVTLSSSISLIFGYSAGFSTEANSAGALATPTPLGGTVSGGSIAYLSNAGAPQVNPNSSILMTCSGIKNAYSTSSIIHAFASTGTAFGALIQDRPNQLSFSPLIPGGYSQLRVQFLGTNQLPLAMNDPNSTILLVVKEN